jgi:chromosome segregation ATPase
LRKQLEVARKQLEAPRVEVETQRVAIESQRIELDAERIETETARRERDAFATRIRDLEAELEEKNNELAAFGGEASGEHARELQALEERLSDRGQEIRRLERDVAEAERIGKELVAEVRLGRALPVSTAASSEELDTLALRLATAEADREALSWVVSIHGQPRGRS